MCLPIIGPAPKCPVEGCPFVKSWDHHGYKSKRRCVNHEILRDRGEAYFLSCVEREVGLDPSLWPETLRAFWKTPRSDIT